MPKLVDHRQRRGDIIAGVRRLIAVEGVGGITMAKAADAAGISTGQVQHYFDSKDDLLQHTYRQVLDRRARQVADLTRRSVSERLPIRDVVTTVLRELLPLDAERAIDHRITVALLDRATTNPVLAADYAGTLTTTRRQLAQAIHNGKECGEVPDDADETWQAHALLALAEGLALHHVEPDRDTIETILAQAIRNVFSGECRQWT